MLEPVEVENVTTVKKDLMNEFNRALFDSNTSILGRVNSEEVVSEAKYQVIEKKPISSTYDSAAVYSVIEGLTHPYKISGKLPSLTVIA